MLKGDNTRIREPDPRDCDMASAVTGFLNVPNANHYMVEGDTFGMAKEYPHLIDESAQRQPSRGVERQSIIRGGRGHQSSNPSAKQRAEQEQFSLTSLDTEFISQRPDAGSDDARHANVHIPTTNAHSNSQYLAVQARPLSRQPTAMEGSGFARMTIRSDPRKLTRPSSYKTSHGRSVQPSKRLLLPLPDGSAKEDVTSDAVTPATFQVGGREVPSPTDSASPSPAPNIPLPPLPRGNTPHRSLFRGPHSPSPETMGLFQIPQRRLSTPPPKSTAHKMPIGDGSEEKAPNRTASKPMVHHKRQGLREPLKIPGKGAAFCEDPFEQRKLRTEKTQALKKRDLESIRALQQEIERVGKEVYRATSDFVEDTDDTIVLPSVPSTSSSQTRAVAAGASPSQPDDWSDWTFDTHQEAIVPRTDLPVYHLEEENTLGHLGMRPLYCSHSTQCSPLEKSSSRIPLSPPLSPSVPLFERFTTHKINLQCLSCERHRQSKHNSAPTNHTAADAPELPSRYLDDLENRLENRLAAFERRTILLEAALLAVINTSVKAATNGVEGRDDGLSGMSGRAEGLAPLESKLEAMIAGINGFGR